MGKSDQFKDKAQEKARRARGGHEEASERTAQPQKPQQPQQPGQPTQPGRPQERMRQDQDQGPLGGGRPEPSGQQGRPQRGRQERAEKTTRDAMQEPREKKFDEDFDI